MAIFPGEPGSTSSTSGPLFPTRSGRKPLRLWGLEEWGLYTQDVLPATSQCQRTEWNIKHKFQYKGSAQVLINVFSNVLEG